MKCILLYWHFPFVFCWLIGFDKVGGFNGMVEKYAHAIPNTTFHSKLVWILFFFSIEWILTYHTALRLIGCIDSAHFHYFGDLRLQNCLRKSMVLLLLLDQIHMQTLNFAQFANTSYTMIGTQIVGLKGQSW